MTVIGVTGTFCTGKTTVCKFFKELGAGIVDADKIVHQLYKKDTEIKRRIAKNFGRGVFTRGAIDRNKLATKVFTRKRSLNKLTRIVHPRVIRKIKEEIRKRKKTVFVIDAPLLIEAHLHEAVDYVVVVKATLKKQIERCAAKGFTKRDLRLRRTWQMPLRKKVKYADFVIDNSGSKRYTRKEVIKVWNEVMRKCLGYHTRSPRRLPHGEAARKRVEERKKRRQ